MNRKDMILIAVLINAGLLSVLFVTAVIYDTDKILDSSEINSTLAEVKEPPINDKMPTVVAMSESSGDEVDNALNYYSARNNRPIVVETRPEVYVPVPAPMEEESTVESSELKTTNKSFFEVTVKKGDVLEKIARNNGTTVSAIKKANQLKSERLQIGQVLRIPINGEEVTVVNEPVVTPSKKAVEKSENKDQEPVYYVIKNGDNPWKIARTFNVKFEDILRLNQLDEEKARNLKVGDRVRVK